MSYRVRACVKEIRGHYAISYKPGDCFLIERYYIRDARRGVCLHALAAILTLVSPFLKGVSARALDMGREDDVGYVQCPDPGEPYTSGGTVVFELRREEIKEY